MGLTPKRIARFSLVLVVATLAWAQELARNGEWWLKLSEEEQEVFAMGFVDCACFHKIDAVCTDGLSARQLAEYTALYFYRNVDKRARPVREVFREQVPRASCKSREYGGEVFEGPHGFCVGEYWRGALYDLPAKTAFVAGYLECYRHVVKGDLMFPLSAEEYAKKIDEWYGFDEEEETIRPGTENVPIADVLMKFGIPKGVSKARNGKP